MITTFPTTPRANGTHRPSARFDDGVPERRPGDAIRPPKVAPPEPDDIDEDFDDDDQDDEPAEPQREAIDSLFPGRKPARAGKPIPPDKRIYHPDHPERPLSFGEAAKMVGSTAVRVYQNTHGNNATNGVKFQWIEGRAPVRRVRRSKGAGAKGEKGRQSATRVVCDRCPGKLLTLKEAAALAGARPLKVYKNAYRGSKTNGYRFEFAPGHVPPGKPVHVPRTPDPRSNHHAKAGSVGKGKTARPSPEAPNARQKPAAAPERPNPGPPTEPLTPSELGQLVARLAKGAGRVDAEDVRELFEWAATVRADYGNLLALLDGSAEAFVADKVYIRPSKA